MSAGPPPGPALPADAPFRHAPYAAGVRPFSIGLAPLPEARWLEPDARLAAELAEKERILEAEGETAFRAETGTQAAQDEAARLVLDHLARRFPRVWRSEAAGAAVAADGFARAFSWSDFSGRALDLAGRLVQDDLVLMRRDERGWRLVAASLAFPSSWSLAEKFARPMGEIHAAVPGYPGRMAERVDRIFDHLRPGAPVWRLNWSLYADAALRHDLCKNAPVYGSERAGRAARDLFVRVERQTLRRLPRSGDILFTIRVLVDPAADLRRHPDGARLAAALADALAALDEAQLVYKGLAGARDRLADEFRALAARRRT